jgi:hypothetical protein
MKQFAISFLVAGFALTGASSCRASEAAPDSETAVETLRIGIATHPDQAAMLFQDSLQTNPDSRRDLLVTALGILGDDPVHLTRLLYAARLEFPEDDALFAETALTVIPERSAEIRASFAASAGQMKAVLGGASVEPFLPPVESDAASAQEPPPPPRRGPSEESRRLDEAIREAMSRVAAKTTGRLWPEQAVAADPIRFRKHDEVRIPRQSRVADESSLFNHLPLDRSDEREIAPGIVKIDDLSKPAGLIRLDESKFTHKDREASTAPLNAKTSERSPAGSVALPRRPPLPRSSVYYIPPAAGAYESTIDREQGATAPPALIIRPEAASPTAPRRPS